MENPEPPPPNDFASRFKPEAAKQPEAAKPQPAESTSAAEPQTPSADTPKSEPAAVYAAQPRPYTLGALLESSLIAPLRPFLVFEEAARRPQPGFDLLAVNALLYALAFVLLNLVHAIIAYPASLDGYGAPRVAVIGAVALVVLLFGGFAFAAGLHVVSLLSGGKGSFSRSYQAVSLMSVLLPLQSAALWLPPAAVLPTALAAVLAAAALEKLHEAKPLAARALCGALAALVLAGGWLAKRSVESFAAPYVAAQQALTQEAAGPGAAVVMPPSAAGAPDLGAAAAALQSVLAAAQAASTSTAAGAPQASGLDMISAPSGEGAPPSGASAPPAPMTPQQVQALNQSGANMLGSVSAMLNQSMAGVPPAQRAQLQQLSAMMTQVQGNMQSGRPLTPEQRAQFNAQMKQVLSQVQAMQQKGALTPPSDKPKGAP